MKTLNAQIKEEELILADLELKLMRSKSESKDNAWDSWMQKQIESKKQYITKLKEENAKNSK